MCMTQKNFRAFHLCPNPCDFQNEVVFWAAWLCHSADSKVCLWPCLCLAWCSATFKVQSPRRLEDRETAAVLKSHLLTYMAECGLEHLQQTAHLLPPTVPPPLFSLPLLFSLLRLPFLSVLPVELWISWGWNSFTFLQGGDFTMKWRLCVLWELLPPVTWHFFRICVLVPSFEFPWPCFFPVSLPGAGF